MCKESNRMNNWNLIFLLNKVVKKIRLILIFCQLKAAQYELTSPKINMVPSSQLKMPTVQQNFRKSISKILIFCRVEKTYLLEIFQVFFTLLKFIITNYSPIMIPFHQLDSNRILFVLAHFFRNTNLMISWSGAVLHAFCSEHIFERDRTIRPNWPPGG